MGQTTSQRRHEAPEVGAMVRRMVRGLVRRAAEGDVEALEALTMLERELPTATSCALGMMNSGTGAHGGGWSFGYLADVVGTSRQAVRQRVARVDTDDDVAAWYSDGASAQLDWTVAR